MNASMYRSLVGACVLLLPVGCQFFAVREQVDGTVCEMAQRPVDLQPLDHAAVFPLDGEKVAEAGKRPPERNEARPPRKEDERSRQKEELEDKPEDHEKNKVPSADRLIPPGLPGGNAPALRLPEGVKTAQDKRRVIEGLYPALAELPAERPLPPGPLGRPFTLGDLQQLALTNSPVIRQAVAEVEAAKGQAVQAGLSPNPVVGYQGDTIRQGDTAGLQGAFIDQTIKTAGKLKIAKARALQEVRLAEIALARSRFDLMTQVRSGYFNVLAAQANARIARLLVVFTDRVYRIQVDRVQAGQAALYEPAQLRVLAVQARNALVQAQNREVATWKALAATLGLPGLPPTQLHGRIDMPVPLYRYEDLLCQVMARHTDVLSAAAQVDREQFGLRLAQVTPIPDVNLGFVVQKDNTTEPFNVVYNVRVGVPLPIWDKNQGNIRSAQARLERSLEESHRVRNDLTTRLAEAFERYASNRTLLENYQKFILPDQVRAFRGAYDAHQQNPDRVGFGDVVNAQQTLAAAVTTYVGTLTSMWQSVVDVANLLQTEDLFQIKETFSPVAVADALAVPGPPCHRPCSPLADPALQRPDPSWPVVGPEPAPAQLPAPQERGKVPDTLPMPRKTPAKGAMRNNAKGDLLETECWMTVGICPPAGAQTSAPGSGDEVGKCPATPM